jgi:hypothetical protein
MIEEVVNNNPLCKMGTAEQVQPADDWLKKEFKPAVVGLEMISCLARVRHD